MVNGVEFYQRKEIKDILAYLHLLNNPRDNVAFLRIINTPARGIGKTTIAAIIAHSERTGMTLLDAARHAGVIEGLTKRAAVAVARFVAMYDHVQLAATGPVEEIMGLVLAETGYRQSLVDSDSEEDEERLANIEELLTAAREFDEVNPGDGALEGFLEQASLVNETDAWEVDDDRATLMTLHAAKGLEFPVVFIVAVEDGLLPHERSRDWLDQTEEERRLFFVGITRAQEELYLSLAKYRSFRGQSRLTIPSRFLTELPVAEMDVQDFSWAAPLHSRHLAPRDEAFPPWEGEAPAEPEFCSPTRERGGEGLQKEETPPVRLMTGAQLSVGATGVADETPPAEQSPAVSADVFHHGMVVRHPKYGLGKIIALSGNGPKRTATVAFVEGHGEKRFILAHSPLRPAKNGG
jgi:DNA helicase-2/ATP-dependent DNA helicase PcrA